MTAIETLLRDAAMRQPEAIEPLDNRFAGNAGAHANDLKVLHERLRKNARLKVGDIVVWKDGLRNRLHPAYGQPAIVSAILDPPLTDPEDDSSTCFYRERLTVVLGVIVRGSLVEYHFDGRRFRKASAKEIKL